MFDGQTRDTFSDSLIIENKNKNNSSGIFLLLVHRIWCEKCFYACNLYALAYRSSEHTEIRRFETEALHSEEKESGAENLNQIPV
jgi:hypothetical protein